MAPGYRKGELIMVSRPYVYALTMDCRNEYCDYCFKRYDTLECCSGCNVLYYCSQECKKKAWNDHKDECDGLKKIHPNELTMTALVPARVILKLKKYGHKKAFERFGTYKRFFSDLMSHSENMKGDSKMQEKMYHSYNIAKKIIGDDKPLPLDEFREIFCKLEINGFDIVNEMLDNVGHGLYIGPSGFDHSCDPDAEVVYDGMDMRIYAIRDIPHKDLKKIHISYVDQMNLSEDRRGLLSKKFYFTCQCNRCTDPHYDELMKALLVSPERAEKILKRSKAALDKINEMKKTDEPCSAIYEVSVDALPDQEGILASTHLYHVWLLEQAQMTSIELEKWAEALEYALQLIGPYKLYYHDYHPAYSLQLMSIIQLQFNLDQDKDAEAFIKEAEEVIRIMYGSSHDFYKELQHVLQTRQKELAEGITI